MVEQQEGLSQAVGCSLSMSKIGGAQNKVFTVLGGEAELFGWIAEEAVCGLVQLSRFVDNCKRVLSV